MSLERALQRLVDLRYRDERLDRLASAVMANPAAARAVRASVKGAVSASRLASRLAPARSPETKPPTVFFIVGQARSGTTWVRSTLGAHPEILCRGEGRLFERSFLREDFEAWELKNIAPVSLYGALARSEHLRAWLERSVWAADRDVEEHLDRLTRLAVEYFMVGQLEGTGKHIVGDKTPFTNPEFVREISRILPEARMVHIIRDGRDVAVSRVHHMWNYAESEGGLYDLSPEEISRRDAFRSGTLGEGESLFAPQRLADIAADWSAGVGRVMDDGAALLGDRYLEVRYEDLLADPVPGVRRLLGFLGARDDEAVARRCVEAASFERGARRSPGEEDSSSRFRKGIAGDWKNAFTAGDRRVFKEAAGDVLIRLGYEDDPGW